MLLLETRAVRVAALLALLAFAFAFQGSRGLYSPDEGRYTGVALEMLRTGDWLHPRLHHELPHYTKPPLTYWMIAAGVGALGPSEWAARLPYALAFVLTTLLVFAMGRVLVPRRPWLPALTYASALLPGLAANVVTTDTPLAATIAIYALAFLRARAAPDARARAPWVALLWLGAGLAFLAKGPPGLLPLVAMLVASAFAPGEPRPRAYFSAVGLACFALAGLGWYLVVGLEQPDLVRYFLVEEIWHRVTSAEMRRNAQWYGALVVYVPTLVLGLLPWTIFALAPAWRALRAPRDAFARLRADRDGWLLACWVALPLVVFFVARSRLPFYLLPLFVPMALALARKLEDVPLARWHAIALGAWLVALLALRAGAAQLPRDEDDRRLAQAIAALGLGQVDEVAFVDTTPRYGLGLYLGTSVEVLSLDTDARDMSPTQDIAEELAEGESGCRLMLTPKQRAAELARELAVDAQREYRALGEAGGYAVFTDDPASCKPR